jgi:pyruvate ferredoxin oxidoreductase gamma subunit
MTRSGGGRGSVEIRFHGRGGQGVVTAAELLSTAAFNQGRHAQSIPSFGSERTGAPVVAFCRVADRPIRAHDPVTAPDVVVVQDPTMLHLVGILDGLGPEGLLLVNSTRPAHELGLAGNAARLVTVPATDLARARLGRPLPNTALLGALAGLTGVVSLASVQAAIRGRFDGDAGEVNAELAADGFRLAREGESRAQAG